MNDTLTKWVTGVAAVLVAAAVVGLWSTMSNLTGAVADLKTTNAEVRGAIERLGDRLEAASRLTELTVKEISRQSDRLEKRLEPLDQRLGVLERKIGVDPVR